MIYKGDYIETKVPIIWTNKTTKCKGFKLTVDGFGYKGVACENNILEGNLCFIKDCECSKSEPYCSESCCWVKCVNCKKKICRSCYMYRDSNCVYCSHKGNYCDCTLEEYLCGNE